MTICLRFGHLADLLRELPQFSKNVAVLSRLLLAVRKVVYTRLDADALRQDLLPVFFGFRASFLVILCCLRHNAHLCFTRTYVLSEDF